MNTETVAPIVQEITIAASPERIFAALTTPEELTKWWGSDDDYRCTEMHADVRPGGRWRTTGVGRDGTAFSVEGVYRIVEPPRMLEFTWTHDWGDNKDRETIVRYELIPRGTATLLRVTHSGFEDAASRDGHNEGWKRVLNWLKDHCE